VWECERRNCSLAVPSGIGISFSTCCNKYHSGRWYKDARESEDNSTIIHANKNNKRWKLTILSENPTDVEKSLIKFTWTSRNLSGSKTQWKKENLLLLSVSRCDNATMCRNLRHNVFFSTSMEKGPFTKLLNCPLSHSGSGGAFFSPSS